MKVIISGATSMIGAALTKQFIDNGHDVYAIVRPNTPKLSLLPVSPRLTVIQSELDDYATIKPVKADMFYHFAWEGTSREARASLDVQMKNVGYTKNAIAYAIQCKCRTFIGAGSQAEYGPQKSLISEDTLPQPNTAYGVAKLAAGLYGKAMAEQAGMRFIWTRIFSVYGPHDNAGTMIMSTIGKALNGEELRFSSCEQCWNYLYETDAANIFYRLGVADVEPGIYNVANNKSRTLREYVELMVKAMKRDGIPAKEPVFDASIKPTAYLNANTKKLYRAISEEPEVSFIRGIHEVIAERKKNA